MKRYPLEFVTPDELKLHKKLKDLAYEQDTTIKKLIMDACKQAYDETKFK